MNNSKPPSVAVSFNVYIIGFVIIVVAGIASVTILLVTHASTEVMAGTVFGFCTAMASALLLVLRVQHNQANSRFDDLLALNRKADVAEGKVLGAATEREQRREEDRFTERQTERREAGRAADVVDAFDKGVDKGRSETP